MLTTQRQYLSGLKRSVMLSGYKKPCKAGSKAAFNCITAFSEADFTVVLISLSKIPH
ncbi:MAG: hypothetical protein WAL30_07055 [Candidatus Aquirickettsiella sp.]